MGGISIRPRCDLEKELSDSKIKEIKKISLWSITITTSVFFSCYFSSYFSDKKFFDNVNYCAKSIANYVTGLF